MKKRTIVRILYVLIVFGVGAQNLKAQTDPPETLPDIPVYDASYVNPIFSDEYSGAATIKKFSFVGTGTGSQTAVSEDNMLKFANALGAWSFIEFNEIINLEDYDYLCFDVYTVEANFFIKVRFNEASTPPGSSYIKAGGTAKQGEWTRIKVALKDYYAAVTGTKPAYNNISKLGFINHGGQARTIYLDNIYAYKSSSLSTLTNIAKSASDLVLAGPWSDTDFESIDNTFVTSLDINDVAGIESKPVTLNSNCLIYTSNPSVSGTNVVLNGTAPDGISIQEGLSFNNVQPFSTSNFTYLRSYDNEGWGSLCLPYALENIPEGMKVYGFSSVSGTSVTFESVESIEANTPYIVHIEAAGLKNFSLTGGTFDIPVTKLVPIENNGMIFKGTFSQISGKGMYLLNGNGTGFAHGGEGATIPAFRAYIEDKTSSEAGVKKLSLGFNEGGTTSLHSPDNTVGLFFLSVDGQLIIHAGEAQNINIYKLDGCLLKNMKLDVGSNVITDLPTGFFIINGQKVMVK